jgi:hypothetical protein
VKYFDKKMFKTKKPLAWVKIWKQNETKRFNSNNSETKKSLVRVKIFWRRNEKKKVDLQISKTSKMFGFRETKRSILIIIYWENVKMFAIFWDETWKTKGFENKRSKVWHYYWLNGDTYDNMKIIEYLTGRKNSVGLCSVEPNIVFILVLKVITFNLF